jgi:hypothetical protein
VLRRAHATSWPFEIPEVHPSTWAETADLCDGQERFAAQPSAAQCSGVLAPQHAPARIPEREEGITAGAEVVVIGNGSGVFASSGVLRGVVARGGLDYQIAPEGCAQVRTSEGGPSAAQEQITYAERARDGLCALDPRRALCGPNSAPVRGCSAAPAPQRARSAPWLALALALCIALLRRQVTMGPP